MSVKKILNEDSSNVVEEMLNGYLLAYRRYYKKIGEYNAFKYRAARKDKVAIVIGGGSGHEPLFPGFCGSGLADAVACGGVGANGALREKMEKECAKRGIKLFLPPKILCTDNAAMIGAAAYFAIKEGKEADALTLDANPDL